MSIPFEVSDRSYRRLTRWAVYAAFTVVLTALAIPWPDWGGLVLVASLPLLLAVGPFQADVALNPELDDEDRRRWRVALFVLPWGISLYWYRYVRR